MKEKKKKKNRLSPNYNDNTEGEVEPWTCLTVPLSFCLTVSLSVLLSLCLSSSALSQRNVVVAIIKSLTAATESLDQKRNQTGEIRGRL